jgi:SAM-dependent methyltransferase
MVGIDRQVIYQLLAAAAAIAYSAGLALRRAEEPARKSQIAGRVMLAILAAIAAAIAANNLQRVIPLLPVFPLALLAGLWVALSPFKHVVRLALALAAIALSQPIMSMTWALVLPIALAWLLFRPRKTPAATYGDFWEGVGESFPDLGGAPSTDFYRANEIRLISSALPDLRGLRILKTDLWDEARNTRIMQWASSQGAEIVGIDISPPTLRKARDQFEPGTLKASVADVRRLPFADASFDAIYSMGTIEHFDESADAVVEMARVLKRGGRLILGVPNRFDPFLRPVMVWTMWCLGLYGYGFEKSYSRRALRRMMQRAGFEVVDETGILFIPGWLRMADLAAHTRMPALAPFTGAAVRIFVRLDARFMGARRHGYLIATVGKRGTRG